MVTCINFKCIAGNYFGLIEVIVCETVQEKVKNFLQHGVIRIGFVEEIFPLGVQELKGDFKDRGE